MWSLLIVMAWTSAQCRGRVVCDELSFRNVTGITGSFLLVLRFYTACESQFNCMLSKWKSLTEGALIGQLLGNT